MEENQKDILRLNQLAHNKNGEVLIVHRRDDKKIIHETDPPHIDGTITAPGNYIKNRPTQFEHDRIHILWSLAQLYIKIKTKEHYPTLSYEISGQLTKNPDLDKMCLNTKKMLTVKEAA